MVGGRADVDAEVQSDAILETAAARRRSGGCGRCRCCWMRFILHGSRLDSLTMKNVLAGSQKFRPNDDVFLVVFFGQTRKFSALHVPPRLGVFFSFSWERIM